MSFAQSLKNKWRVKVKDLAQEKCKRIAFAIEQKANTNISKAATLTSNTQYYYSIISNKESSKSKIEYDVCFVGDQLAFLEFGTGIYNPSFKSGLSDYVPSIAKTMPDHASFGKGLGKNEIWVFPYETNVSNENGDVVYDYRVYHRKRDGGVSIYQLSKPVIATKGISPQRMIYNAILDVKREVAKKW